MMASTRVVSSSATHSSCLLAHHLLGKTASATTAIPRELPQLPSATKTAEGSGVRSSATSLSWASAGGVAIPSRQHHHAGMELEGSELQQQQDARRFAEAVAESSLLPKDPALYSSTCKRLLTAAARTLEGVSVDAPPQEALLVFQGQNIPTISLRDYMDRVMRYIDAWSASRKDEYHAPRSDVGLRCVLIGVEYVERLVDQGLRPGPSTIHRLILVASLVAAKYTEDFVLSNRFMSKVGGVELDALNRMEMAFCALMGWKFTVGGEDMLAMKNRLEALCAGSEMEVIA